MILPTAEFLAARRRGYQRRSVVLVLVVGLIGASVVLPHVMVEAATIYPGRSLISVSRFFLSARAGAAGFAGATSVAAVGLGLSITYLGLALHQVGAAAGLAFSFVLVAEEVGRWTRRLASVAGLLLVLSSATVVLGYQQLTMANVPTLLGVAWLPTLLAGLALLIGARVARRRLSSTWFLEKPEIVQP